jgi:SAM-dependent methyltransferase
MSIAYGTKEWFEQKFANVDALGDKWGHRFRSSQKYRLNLCLGMIAPLLSETASKKILDIGCGLGDFLQAVQHSWAQHELHGCDISENAVRQAQAENPSIHFRCETLPELSYGTGAFDLVMAIEVLSYLGPAERTNAMKQIAECTAADGSFLFSGVVNGGERYFTETEIRALIERHFRIEHIRFNYARIYGYFETGIYGLVALERAYALNNLEDVDLYFGSPRLRAILKSRLVKAFFGSLLRIARPLLLWVLSLQSLVELGDWLGRRILGEAAKTNMIVVARKI